MHLGRGFGLVGMLAVSTAAWSQPAPAILECNEEVGLAATPHFDPPVQGPLSYEWRDEQGAVVGNEASLARRFPVGAHLLTLVASTAEGRTARSSVRIVVRDTRPPRIQVTTPLVTLDAPVATLDVVRIAQAIASDLCDPNPTLQASTAGPFAAGETRVTLTASDASGQTSTAVVVVRVAAEAPPARGAAPPVGGAPPEVSKPQPPAADAGGGEPAAGAPASSTGGQQQPPAGVAPGPPAGPAAPEPATPPTAPPLAVPGPAEPAVEQGTPLAWLGVLVTVLALFFLVAALVRRRRGGPPASLRTVARLDAGTQTVVLPPGVAYPSFDITMRPRVDAGAPQVAGEVRVVHEERGSDHVRR